MEETKFIYQIYNFANCKSYIGSTKFPDLRFRQHMNLLNRRAHPNKELQDDFNLYGDVFYFLILEEKTGIRETSNEYKWMRKLETYNEKYGYNNNDWSMQPIRKDHGMSYIVARQKN